MCISTSSAETRGYPPLCSTRRSNRRLREALGSIIAPIDAELRAAASNGQIRPIQTIDLFMSVLTLCLGTFLIIPVFRNVWEMSDAEYSELICRRRTEIKETILSRLKP